MPPAEAAKLSLSGQCSRAGELGALLNPYIGVLRGVAPVAKEWHGRCTSPLDSSAGLSFCPLSGAPKECQVMAERLTLPVLPLREVVLFPGVTAPIGAGRPATLRAIEAALAGSDRLVFAVSQRQNVESVTSDALYTIGTIARIGQLQRGMSGMQLLLHGEQRAMSLHVTEEKGHLVAVVRPLEDIRPVDENDPSFTALHKELRARSRELGQKSGLP